VHQIIRGLPELSFAVVFLGGRSDHYPEPCYPLPDNLIHVECHYLLDPIRGKQARPRKGNRAAFDEARKLIELLSDHDKPIPRDRLTRVIDSLGQPNGLNQDDMLHSRASWEALCDYYRDFCTDPSFIDFFWTARTLLAPLFVVARAANTAPPARIYHAVSTGYAGFLGALLRYRRNVPFVLCEHGIYTKERKIDLARSNWIAEPEEPFGGGLEEDVGYIRRMWIGFFEGLGRLAYDAADPVVSLFATNRERQIRDGAAPGRTRIVPNGVDVEAFAALRHTGDRPPLVVALVGRVVPIKDIKTFIRAMRLVCSRLPEVQGWIVGPCDEDPDYADECRALLRDLELEERVLLLGFMPVRQIMPKMGVMVLTSISEALPLVLLEGFAAGVPAVSTDVGACEELINGGEAADRQLGSAGSVVPIANPARTADAVLELLGNPARWRAARQAGIARVTRYYTQEIMLADYRQIYQRALENHDDSRNGLDANGRSVDFAAEPG
jgi:glycosyltransferase involved in cell wall biosynthesis